MKSRKLTKRFELWQTSNVSDGFGGVTVADQLISSSWCEIKTANASSKFRSTDNGITTATNQIIITTRKRNDLTYNNINQFIKYRGDKYIISNQPYENEFDNMFIEIVATKENLKNVEVITPI
jgi:head-tail adaptor